MTTSLESTGDTGLNAIMGERRNLINLAYRLLGSRSEAEDVVQESYARWYAMSERQRAAIDTPGAWLTTVASRICLDLLRSARTRRESYVGDWVPEPLPDRAEWGTGRSSAGDPADRITLDESITMAFLVVLDSMTPAERVALILHDVFGYSFAEVGEIVGRSPAASRQLASSARRRIRASLGAGAPAARQADVIRAFRRAWEDNDLDALLGLLDPDATVISDGGGLVRAALHPVTGSETIARRLLTLTAEAPDLTILDCAVNGQPGLVLQVEGSTVTVMAFAITGGRIKRIWGVRNPDKLRSWTSD